MRYVKPHGALYNDMMRDDAILEAVLTALATAPSPLGADGHGHRGQCPAQAGL